ncbi:hypothetical protein F5Y00DRAFT_273096 [Daldinia vernicosa]|uniref:uncharacterized protein n=1 Tax=Daldinia vernicosa TaxID=114800 RepID=UPI002007CD84|nr:uncharacterized protein F5Y00DRAFT_273096 [Daldinia vernicosa]KAI0852464.1 hypothetical protein F5Y00DRAFT_273096 [Daldinia vernicosa]
MEWNIGNVGIRFQDVPDDQPALFRLTYMSYDSRHPTALAATFLPGVLGDQRLYVYQSCFGELYVERMTTAFCHELGHILGLRHESAEEDADEMTPCFPSYLLGRRNRFSIMTRSLHPNIYRIHEEDYAGVRRFYGARADEFRGYRIIDRDPKVYEKKLWGTYGRTVFGSYALLRWLRISLVDIIYLYVERVRDTYQ